MGIFIKASVASIATYFAMAAYDYYGRDDLKPTPLISAFPPVSIIGKSVVGIGYDGKVLNGFEEYPDAIQWEINKGNNDEVYKKKLIAAGISSLSENRKELYMQTLPQGYKINISDYEMSKTNPAQQSAGFALANQVISLMTDNKMRDELKSQPSPN